MNCAQAAIADSGAEQRLIKTLPRKGVRFVGNVRDQQLLESSATTVVQPGLPLPDMPSIAVLPFQDMSGIDAGHQRRFGDDPPSPDTRDQVVLADNAPSIADQVLQEIENLGLEGNCVGSATEFASFRI